MERKRWRWGRGSRNSILSRHATLLSIWLISFEPPRSQCCCCCNLFSCRHLQPVWQAQTYSAIYICSLYALYICTICVKRKRMTIKILATISRCLLQLDTANATCLTRLTLPLLLVTFGSLGHLPL